MVTGKGSYKIINWKSYSPKVMTKKTIIFHSKGLNQAVLINLFLQNGSMKYKKGWRKIKLLSINTSDKHYENVLQQKEPLNTLNNIYNEFFATPVDKTNGNAAFICQWFCALALIKDLSWFRSEHN